VKHHRYGDAGETETGHAEALRGAAMVMGFLGLLPIIRRAYWSLAQVKAYVHGFISHTFSANK